MFEILARLNNIGHRGIGLFRIQMQVFKDLRWNGHFGAATNIVLVQQALGERLGWAGFSGAALIVAALVFSQLQPPARASAAAG